MLDHKFFKDVGTFIREEYRTHIFTKALDVYDKPFSSKYSQPYGSLKKARKLLRQKGGKINAPKVSWDLLKDFGTIYRVTPTGFEMGWSAYGDRIERLKKLGRVLTTPEQPLPKKIIKLLDIESDKYIDKKLGPDKTVIIGMKK